MTDDDPQEAARRSIDPERLLPGENLDSSDREAAARWAQIYRQLVEAKQILFVDLQAALERASEPARAELQSVDAVLIRVQLERFQRRFRYWTERERELSDVGMRRMVGTG